MNWTAITSQNLNLDWYSGNDSYDYLNGVVNGFCAGNWRIYMRKN